MLRGEVFWRHQHISYMYKHNHAFWHLGRPVIVTAAKDFQILTEKSDSLFQVLFKVIQKHLGLSDLATMDVVAQRFEPKGDEVSQAVLEVDEAAEVLEQDDRKLITENQDQVNKQNHRSATFHLEYKDKGRQINLFWRSRPRVAPRQRVARPQPQLCLQKSHSPQPSSSCQLMASVLYGRATHAWIGMAIVHPLGECMQQLLCMEKKEQ